MAKPVRRGSARSDRGATAVEFALLLPLLVLIVFGMIDFGRAINAQITITQAAREGARVLAIQGPLATDPVTGLPTYQARAKAAALGLSGVTVTDLPDTSSPSQTGCPPNAGQTGDDAVVKVTYKFTFITPVVAFFGTTMQLTAQGQMPCET
jgi:Flp pilus assembly protein TadG